MQFASNSTYLVNQIIYCMPTSYTYGVYNCGDNRISVSGESERERE